MGALFFFAAALAACAAAPTSTPPASSGPAIAPPGSGVPEGERRVGDPLPPGVVPFHAPMTPPNPSTLPPLEPTPEAIAANDAGRIHVSCIITKEGEAKQCVFRATVASMSKAALAAIVNRRFEPAKLGEEPMAVEYDFIWDYPPKVEASKVEPMPTCRRHKSNPPKDDLVQSQPIPFGAKMTRPTRLSGPTIRHTPEALANRVEGLMIVRCVLTTEGKVEDCQAIKTLPYLEDEVICALEASRYTPVLADGVPQRVRYTFTLQFVLP